MRFELEPYNGIGPLRFQMAQDEVESLLGPPARRMKDRDGEIELMYPTLSARFDPNSRSLVEVSFLPGSELIVDGIYIFEDRSGFATLAFRDGDPRERVGFVLLYRFGVAMTGFHDNDESQLAVTAFCSGRWDSLRSSTKPLLFPLPKEP